jgi:hypothetical protein
VNGCPPGPTCELFNIFAVRSIAYVLVVACIARVAQVRLDEKHARFVDVCISFAVLFWKVSAKGRSQDWIAHSRLHPG